MFVPIYDENSLKSIGFQYMTVLLIALNAAVFAAEATGMHQTVIASFGIIPSQLVEVGLWGGPVLNGPDAGTVPEHYTLLSYMFFHGNLMHLAGNMLFLWVFGDNVEDALGHIKFLIFYILCGIAAGLAHTAIMPQSTAPLIGASGAVAGVIAAYLLLHPRVTVWVLAFRFIPLKITAALALGAWILMQLFMILVPQQGPIAWWAHVGGLVAGAVLVLVMRRPNVPLLDRGLSGRA